MRTLPLGLRIVLLVIPLALLPLALVGGVAYYYLEAAVRTEIDAAQLRLLSDAVSQITTTVEDAAKVSHALAGLPQVQQIIDPSRGTRVLFAEARRTLDISVQLSRHVSGVTLIRHDGAVIIAAASPETAGAGGRRSLLTAVAARAGTEDEALFAHVDGGVSVFVTHPVRTPQASAFVVVEVGLSGLMDRLVNMNGSPGGRFVLVDDKAHVLASTGRAGSPLQANDLESAIRQAAAARGTARRVATSTSAIVMAASAGSFARVEDPRPARRPVYLVRTAQESGLVDRIKDLRRTALLLAFTAIAFGLIGAGVIARTVVHPLNALLDMTRRIGEGQFNVSLRQARDDEIGQLVGAFNRMAAALAEFQDKLVHAETFAALGRVASTVAHEVRNPLNAILGCVEYLRLKRPDDAIVQHHTTIIGEEITALDEFVNDFLKVARLESPRFAPVDVVSLLQSHVDLHTIRAAEQQVVLDLTAGDGLFPVSADSKQLGIVVENLINNAIEAMPHGGHLGIRVERAEEGVSIAFADTGTGIPPSAERNLFTPFFTTKPDGTGIGLAISRRIVEAHSGTIHYETAPDMGTVFTVTLRRRTPEADENSAESS